MIEHLPIVRFIARRIHERLPQHVPIEDLYSAGVVGLLDAFGKFDPSKQVQFRSYAQFRIRGAILDNLRTLDWSPRELRRKGRAIEQAIQTLTAQFGRAPNDMEIAAQLHIDLAAYQQLLGELKGLEIGTLHSERSRGFGGRRVGLPAQPARGRSPLSLPARRNARAADRGHRRPTRARAPGHDALLLRRDDHERDRADPGCGGVPDLADPRLRCVAPSRPSCRLRRQETASIRRPLPAGPQSPRTIVEVLVPWWSPHVTKVPFCMADDATLKSGMDPPTTRQQRRPSAKIREPQIHSASSMTFIDEERLKKIAKLKQAVADGTYHVSAEEVADKLIEHMLEPKGYTPARSTAIYFVKRRLGMAVRFLWNATQRPSAHAVAERIPQMAYRNLLRPQS